MGPDPPQVYMPPCSVPGVHVHGGGGGVWGGVYPTQRGYGGAPPARGFRGSPRMGCFGTKQANLAVFTVGGHCQI